MENDYKSAREGWVYCIVNYRDRERVKIGMTTRPMELRMKEANGTFTVDGFYIAIAKFVRNPYQKEQAIHNILSEHRVSARREFFDVQRPGVFPKILQLFELMDGDTHADSKMRLDYEIRRARVSDFDSGDSENSENGRVRKRAKTFESFRDAFRSMYESAPETCFVPVQDVVRAMEERGFSDVTVDMQSIHMFPYENARRQMVYRGIRRITIDLSAFRYSDD